MLFSPVGAGTGHVCCSARRDLLAPWGDGVLVGNISWAGGWGDVCPLPLFQGRNIPPMSLFYFMAYAKPIFSLPVKFASDAGCNTPAFVVETNLIFCERRPAQPVSSPRAAAAGRGWPREYQAGITPFLASRPGRGVSRDGSTPGGRPGAVLMRKRRPPLWIPGGGQCRV